ncbi:MAG: hypothetical protein F6J87_07240 [Spirulina sp. SIO3F2]|nr:hypothetical protein [Spirulina sp. SIO3F2]
MADSTSSDQQQSTADVYVGLQVSINDNPVNLMPKTPINKIEENGLELSLEKPVNIGELGAAIESIGQSLAVPAKATAYLAADRTKRTKTNFTPIDNFIDDMVTAELTIEALEYKKPAKNELDQNTKYLFAASVTWDKSQPKPDNSGFFEINAMYVLIADGYAPEKTQEVLSGVIKSLPQIEGSSQDEGEGKVGEK